MTEAKELQFNQRSMRQLVMEESDVYGLECYLTFPSGKQYVYSRIIGKEFLENSTPEQVQFFGDDMMTAFKKVVPE